MPGKARSRARGLRRSRARCCRRGRARHRRWSCARDTPTRDWASGLPRDVLSLIFSRLGAIEVLHSAQAVCRSWHSLAAELDIWRRIDMRNHARRFNRVYKEALARNAVDRSGGHVEEFYAQNFGSDELLDYIAERTTGLKCLVLISTYGVSEEGLVKFVGRCPLLEELQIINCSFSAETCGAIGRARPELKRFSLNDRCSILNVVLVIYPFYDTKALEIANMPQLLELQLFANLITNEGLGFILDKCPLLETLDIRMCFHIKVDASMKARLATVRNVRLPSDSTADYGYPTIEYICSSYVDSYSDSDLSSDDMFDFGYDDASDYDFDYNFTVYDRFRW